MKELKRDFILVDGGGGISFVAPSSLPAWKNPCLKIETWGTRIWFWAWIRTEAL